MDTRAEKRNRTSRKRFFMAGVIVAVVLLGLATFGGPVSQWLNGGKPPETARAAIVQESGTNLWIDDATGAVVGTGTPDTRAPSTWAAAEGNGTQTNPWIIETPDKLAGLALILYNIADSNNSAYQAIQGGWQGKYFAVTRDLDLRRYGTGQTYNGIVTTDYTASIGAANSGKGWFPIGKFNGERAFRGNFDGRGHVIRNLYINRTTNSNDDQFVGLFGRVGSGVIQNLGIASGSITGYNMVGGFVGGVTPRAANSTIGISADASLQILNCWNNAAVSCANTNTTTIYVAGIIGQIYNLTANVAISVKIHGCYNTGTVTVIDAASRTEFVGGILSWLSEDTGHDAAIDTCFNAGSVTISGSGTNASARLGGLAGYLGVKMTVENCYNSGALTGPENGSNVTVSGLVATRSATAGTNAVRNSYSAGSLSGARVYGITGQIVFNVSDCFYLNPEGDTVHPEGKLTLAQMLTDGNADGTGTGMGTGAMSALFGGTGGNTAGAGHWEKRPNDATDNYYPELSYFKNFTDPTTVTYTANAAALAFNPAFITEVQAVSLASVTSGGKIAPTAALGDWTYGDTAPALTTPNVPAGTFTVLYTGTDCTGAAYNSATQPVNAGGYTVTVTYDFTSLSVPQTFYDVYSAGTATSNFTIHTKKVTAIVISGGLPSSPLYNGSAHPALNPNVTFTVGGIAGGVNNAAMPAPYRLEYTNSNGAPASGAYAGNQTVNAGTVSVKVVPTNNYEWDTAAGAQPAVTGSYTIRRCQVDDLDVSVNPNPLPKVPYKGSPYFANAADFPGFAVSFPALGFPAALAENTDYTLSYSNSSGGAGNSTDAGIVTVTVTPVGNFDTGNQNHTFTFEIEPKLIDVSNIRLQGFTPPLRVTYTGSPVTVSGLSVYADPEPAALTENRDFTFTYWDGDANHPGQAINVGAATLTVTLTGNYAGTAPLVRAFRISNNVFTPAAVTVTGLPADVTYDGHAWTVSDFAGFTVLFDGVAQAPSAYTVGYTGNTDAGTAAVNITPRNNAISPETLSQNPGDWPKAFAFQIAKAPIDGTADVTVTGNVPLEYLGGTAVEYPTGGAGALAVTFNGVTVTQGVDFDIVYTNNTAIGSAAQFFIVPKGNYEAALDLLSLPLYYTGTFSIVPTALTNADVQITGYNNMRFTGSAIVFNDPSGINTLKVYFHNVLAVEGVDYTVSYSDDQGNAASAIGASGSNATGTITITPTPALYGGGPFTAAFVIVGTPVPSQPANFNVTGMPAPANVVYDGHAWVVSDFQNFAVTYTYFDTVSLSNKTVTLTEGLDYAVSYSNTSGGANNSTNAGTVTVTVTIINQYYSVAPLALPSFAFVILKADYNMTGVTFASGTVPYDGTIHSLTAAGLPSGVSVSYEYDGVPDTGKTNGGVYAVTAVFATADPNYNVPANMTATLTITVNVSVVGGTFNVTGLSDKPYRGTPYTAADFAGFAVTYTYPAPSGQVVTLASSDYMISYSNSSGGAGNSTNVGTVTVTVTVTASYFTGGGTATATFAILQGTYSMSGVTFANGTFPYDGTVKSLAVSGTLPAGVTVSYLYNGAAGTGETLVGTYAVTAVFATSDPNYGAPANMTATLRIDKAAHNMSGVTFANGTFAYDGTVKSLAVSGLPSGVTVSYLYGGVPGTGETAVGTYTVTAVFGVTDTVNYDPPANMTATLTITAGPPNMSGITFPDGTFAYDGTQKSLTVQGTLPAGVSVSYLYDNVPDTGRTAVGTYAVTAVFAVTDPNYTTPADMTATLVIFPQSVVGPPLTTPGGTTPGTPPAPGTPGGPSLPPGTGGSLDGLKPGDKLPDLPDVPPDWKWDGWYDADGNKVTEYPNDGRTLYPTWKWNDSRNAFEKGWEWFTKNVEPYWWFRFPVGFFGALLLGWLFILIPLKRRRDRENER